MRDYITTFNFRGIVFVGFDGINIYFDEEAYLVKLNVEDLRLFNEFTTQCLNYHKGLVKNIETVELW